MKRPLLMMFLTACAPDPWTTARATCGFDEGETVEWAVVLPTDGARNGLSVDGDCAAQLLRDVHGDPDVLLTAFDGGADLGAYVGAARFAEEPMDGLPVAIWGLYWLAGADFGAVGALDEGPYVDAKWVAVVGDAAAARGLDEGAPLAQVLYDLVATRIRGLDVLPPDFLLASAGLGSSDDVLYLPRSIDPDFPYAEDPYAASGAAWVIAHESDHALEPYVPHVDCGSWPEPACDMDLTGAHGFEVAMMWAQATALLDGAPCLDASDSDHVFASEVEASIQGRIDQFVLIDLPERVLVSCD
ncbi:MAG: hypothetical protein Q8P18_03765 [Pseudomonadota bacterium]|nr:hypothetical protein [Pseudomonadota bacterium]